MAENEAYWKKSPGGKNGHKEQGLPWQGPDIVRPAGDPHRGGLILFLGEAVFFFSLLGVPLLGLPWIFTLPWSLTVYLMARRDLRRMSAGLMDPQGRKPTEEGRGYSLFALALSLVFALFWGLFLLYLSRAR
jgi:hypothetical protein